MTTGLQLTSPPPTFNPFPLFAAYSACVLHVIDLKVMIDLTPVSINPILLSNALSIRLFSNSPRSPPKYRIGLHGVVSFSCTLTLIAYHPHFKAKKSLATYILDHPSKCAVQTSSECIQIHPQTVAILSQKSELKFWEKEPNIRKPYLPQVFFFPITANAIEVFQGYFICWYCNLATIGRHQAAQTIQFSCGASCGRAMKLVVKSNVQNSGLHLWDWEEKLSDNVGEKTSTEGPDPFTFANPIRIEKTIGRFLNENYKNETGPAGTHNDIPKFKYSKGSNGMSPPVHRIVTGNAASINFITSAGIVGAKTGYSVYFVPFTRDIWLISLVCGLTCLAVGSICIAVHAFEVAIRQIFQEMSTWTIAAPFGQYKNADIPILRPTETQKALSINMVVVCWLLTVTLLNSFYQATFNSDATTLFPYLTKFSHFWQLENCKLYIPVNDTLFSRMIEAKASLKHSYSYSWEDGACWGLFHDVQLPQCSIIELIEIKRDQYIKISKRSSRLEELERETQILNKLLANSHLVRNTVESMEKISKKMGPNVAFVVWQHEFHYYWEMFAKLMKRRPELKFANNFGLKTTNLQQTVGYAFTGGLDPKYQKAMLLRLSRLVSSGIYGLWEKWDRIRFSIGGLSIDEIKLASSITPVAQLSFYNSGTPWLFFFVISCWVLASVILAVECSKMMLEFFGSRKVPRCMSLQGLHRDVTILNINSAVIDIESTESHAKLECKLN